MDYATVADMELLWRPMSVDEQERAAAVIPLVCASLRAEAKKRGRDLDLMVCEDEDIASVARSVTVDVTARVLMTSTRTEPMTQFTESALGYSASGSYLIPGGGLFIKRSELARLGLNRQRYGSIDMMPEDDDERA